MFSHQSIKFDLSIWKYNNCCHCVNHKCSCRQRNRQLRNPVESISSTHRRRIHSIVFFAYLSEICSIEFLSTTTEMDGAENTVLKSADIPSQTPTSQSQGPLLIQVQGRNAVYLTSNWVLLETNTWFRSLFMYWQKLPQKLYKSGRMCFQIYDWYYPKASREDREAEPVDPSPHWEA
jgi:hypothetical protein